MWGILTHSYAKHGSYPCQKVFENVLQAIPYFLFPTPYFLTERNVLLATTTCPRTLNPLKMHFVSFVSMRRRFNIAAKSAWRPL